MRPDLIEEEYLENERARRAAKLSNITRRFSDKSADRSDKFFKRSVDFQPNNSDETLVSADQEWVCEKCGAEIPPAGRFCAACGQATGYSPGPHIFADMGAQLKKSFGAINEVAARYGLSPASQIALAVAAFCIGGAIIVQFSVPSALTVV